MPGWFKVQGSKFKVGAGWRGHLRFVERNSRRLARSLFHAMVRFGPKLEREQLLLGRFVDIAAELFAMTTACARAQQAGTGEADAVSLADYFCWSARLRVGEFFRSVRHNTDHAGYRLAQNLLDR